MSFFNKVLIYLIKVYRKYVSILLPASCRFEPTCSEYCIKAFRKKNFLKALILCLYRILRCNPFNKGGEDYLK